MIMENKFNFNKYTVQYIKSFILENLALFSLSMIFIVAINIINIALPIYIGKIIDLVNSGTYILRPVPQELYLFVLALIAYFIINPLSGYMLVKFVQTGIKNSTIKWVTNILNKDLSLLSHNNVGRLVSSTDRGILAHESLIGHFCKVVIPLSLELLITSLFLIKFASLKLYSLILLFIITQTVITKSLIKMRRKYIDDVNDSEDGFAGELTEVISNGLVFSLEKKINFAVKRISIFINDYAAASIKLSKSGAILNTLQPFFINISTLAILIYGSAAIANNEMTLGTLVAVLTVSSKLNSSVGGFLDSLRIYDQFKVDIKEFINSQNLPRFTRTGKSLEGFNDKIQIDPMALQYGSYEFKLEHPLHIPKGQKVAIIGTTGGGKSTLLNIIAGIDEESRKVVSIDNQNLNSLSSDTHLKLVRYCPQKPFILSGKTSEGVFFQEQNTSKEQTLMQTLGLDTSLVKNEKSISEGATNISGGEAKRLSLARTLSTSSEIFLFDEPTTALNKESQDLVWKIIFNSLKDKTIICTTHDKSALDQFDRIITIDAGKIISDRQL